MMTSTTPMPAEYLHSSRCLAHAMICAVENMRDEEGTSPLDFRLQAQAGIPLAWADEYLASGTADCLCHSWDIEQVDASWRTICSCGWWVPAGDAFQAAARGSAHQEKMVQRAWAAVTA